MNSSRLKDYISNLQSAIVAFSGGVDSALLAVISHQALGKKMLAVTVDSPSLPKEDREHVKTFCSSRNIPHRFVEGREFVDENFLMNGADRCYHCKKHLYSSLVNLADELSYKYVIEGTNHSDLSGHRPGMKAAEEIKGRVVQPLKELGYSKKDVRSLARGLNIAEANKPSTACLSSRIPFGTRIESNLLERVDDSERYLRSLGIKMLRVRSHEGLARVETDEEGFGILVQMKTEVVKRLRSLGWHYIAVDLEGYRPAVPLKDQYDQ